MIGSTTTTNMKVKRRKSWVLALRRVEQGKMMENLELHQFNMRVFAFGWKP